MTIAKDLTASAIPLNEDAKKMLKHHLRPHIIDGNAEDNQHAFILVGTETLFLCHMTMFHMEEHCYQLVLRVTVPPQVHAQIRTWRTERPDEAIFMATPTGIEVPDLAIGKLRELKMSLYRGITSPDSNGEYQHWPWPKEYAPAIAPVSVNVERVVHYRHFHLGFPPPQHLTYFLFGAGHEAHMQSYQFAEPDFDHVLSLSSTPDWLPENKLEAGVIVSFPAINRIPLPLKNHLSCGDVCQADYQGFSHYLGNPIAPTYPIQIGTTWWWSLSPLNLVMPGQSPTRDSRATHHHGC